MAEEIVLVDTSILIDLFRKTDKDRSVLLSLVRQHYSYCISAVTEYEIYTGTTPSQVDFWDSFLQHVQVLPFDKAVAKTAVIINKELKRKRKLIETADLFIAATALTAGMPLATLNRKHFERIEGLTIVE